MNAVEKPSTRPEMCALSVCYRVETLEKKAESDRGRAAERRCLKKDKTEKPCAREAGRFRDGKTKIPDFASIQVPRAVSRPQFFFFLSALSFSVSFIFRCCGGDDDRQLSGKVVQKDRGAVF